MGLVNYGYYQSSTAGSGKVIFFDFLFTEPHFIGQIFSKIRLAYEHVENRKKLGHSHEEATNLSSIELAQSADAHCRAFLVQTAYEVTKNLKSTISTSLATVLQQFIELYAVDTCMKAIGDLFRVRFDVQVDATAVECMK